MAFPALANSGFNIVRSGPYSYRAGSSTLGIGSDNYALERPGIPIDSPIYGPRYNVHGSFNPLTGASQFPLQVSVPRNDIRAGGVYLSGSMALSALTDFNRANKLGS